MWSWSCILLQNSVHAGQHQAAAALPSLAGLKKAQIRAWRRD